MQVVRAPVALAIVKLLKLLPEDVMVQQLPQALQGVAHLLRNRLQRIRWPKHHYSSPVKACCKGAFLISPPAHCCLSD